MVKKLVNFKLSGVAIAQLNEMAKTRTKVSIIEESIEIAYQNYKRKKESSKTTTNKEDLLKESDKSC